MENANAKYTIDQVLQITLDMLGDICLPVSMNNVSTEIDHARSNIKACIDALECEKEKNRIGGVNDGN